MFRDTPLRTTFWDYSTVIFHEHGFLFRSFSLIFSLIPCRRLNWLPVSISTHVKFFTSYRTLATNRLTYKSFEPVHLSQRLLTRKLPVLSLSADFCETSMPYVMQCYRLVRYIRLRLWLYVDSNAINNVFVYTSPKRWRKKLFKVSKRKLQNVWIKQRRYRRRRLYLLWIKRGTVWLTVNMRIRRDG